MKCVYCGKQFESGGQKINVSNGTFDVCSSACRKNVTDYLNRDREYKNRTYLLIFCGSIGFILSTFFFSGTYKLLPMYIGMVIMGLTLIFYPYVFSSFITFTRYPIVKATRAVRIIGAVIAVEAVAFALATTLKG